jgi:RNA polymerase sigma-70 factor, ECF subfamily
MDEDRRLLRALARREKPAWAEAYDRHVRDIYGFVYHLTGGDIALAEEIHQEVWLAALEGIERFDVRSGRFRDWLMGIARHRVSRHFRGMARVSYATVRGWGSGPELAGLPPPEQLEDLERAEVIRAALVCLLPEQREVLLAKYVEGRSVAEIAGRTGKTAKAIESLLTRARERLRGLLRHYFSHTDQGVSHEPYDRNPSRG